MTKELDELEAKVDKEYAKLSVVKILGSVEKIMDKTKDPQKIIKARNLFGAYEDKTCAEIIVRLYGAAATHKVMDLSDEVYDTFMQEKIQTELNPQNHDVTLRLEICTKLVYHKLKNEYDNNDVGIPGLISKYLETSKQYLNSPFNTNQLVSFNDQIFRMLDTEKLSDIFKVMNHFGEPNILKLVQNSYQQLDIKCGGYESVDLDKDRDNNLVNTLIRMINSTFLGSNNLPVSEFAKKLNHSKLKEFKYTVFEKIVLSLNNPKHSTAKFIDVFMHEPIYNVFLSANEKNQIKLLEKSYDDPNKGLIVQYAKSLDDLFGDKKVKDEEKMIPKKSVNEVTKEPVKRKISPQDFKMKEISFASDDGLNKNVLKIKKRYPIFSSLKEKISQYHFPIIISGVAAALLATFSGIYFSQEPEKTNYKEECVMFYNESKFEEALPMCNQAIVLEPENDVIHGIRGLIYGKNKAYDLALNDFKTAWELNPEENYYLELICTTYHSKGDYDNAIKVCNEVIEHNPGLGMIHVTLDSAYEMKAASESEKYEEKSEEKSEEKPAEEATME